MSKLFSIYTRCAIEKKRHSFCFFVVLFQYNTLIVHSRKWIPKSLRRAWGVRGEVVNKKTQRLPEPNLQNTGQSYSVELGTSITNLRPHLELRFLAIINALEPFRSTLSLSCFYFTLQYCYCLSLYSKIYNKWDFSIISVLYARSGWFFLPIRV